MTPPDRDPPPGRDDPPLTPVKAPDPAADPAEEVVEKGEPFEGNHA